MKNKFEIMLEDLADRKGETVFLYDARNRVSMTYRRFLEQICQVRDFLGEAGVKEGDRVLLMMDNSLEFAVNFFAVTFCQAAAVPVNTNLKWKELLYIMEDTRASGILIQRDYEDRLKDAVAEVKKECPKETAAEEKKSDGISCMRLPLQENVWYQSLFSDGARDLPENTAMLLYTSGTIGYPKGVILSFDNLMSKTADIIEAHQLTDRDRVLCVLPWFHINGLVITLLTPLVSEQTIVIGGRFSVSRFWGYVEEYGITWFSGVPTMYSHMLARGIPEYGKHSSLRFARSASSALPGAVMREFEETCHVPVIESYGITEGCAQITSNPLPPAVHKVNSVGLAYGNRIKVVNSRGEVQPAGTAGEVWIRGSNITCGYYHKPEETERSFTDGWFHSGDVGYLDEEGYLFLNGRIKELINRAGEKFSPLEIDEVLYQMPEVELAAAVGVPDAVYGEEVACFIRLKKGRVLSEQQVKNWCEARIASYKVPRKVFFVDEIPQGGNGKIQRLKLLDVYCIRPVQMKAPSERALHGKYAGGVLENETVE